MSEQKRLCKDCAYYPRCQWLISSVNEQSVECDWTPSRWQPSEAYRLTAAEQERDSLKQQLAEANAEIEKQNTACADMRGALELGKDVVSVFAQFVPDHIRDAKKHIEFINTANHALSSSAGRDLLERVRRGEEAERLLKRVDGMQKAAGNIRSSEASDWGGDWEELVERIDAYLKAGGKDA